MMQRDVTMPPERRAKHQEKRVAKVRQHFVDPAMWTLPRSALRCVYSFPTPTEPYVEISIPIARNHHGSQKTKIAIPPRAKAHMNDQFGDHLSDMTLIPASVFELCL